jgi:K+-transporting ATPase ATPase C chain
MKWTKQIIPAVMSTIVLSVLVSGVYPLIVWGIAQAAFPSKANGSLVERDGKVVGSTLIGQTFADAKYFHPRPSAAGSGYDATSSGGTNLGPTSAKLLEGVKDDPATKDKDESFAGIRQLVESYRQENGLPATQIVPADAVTRSASGLDPQISPENANLQADRVAKARGMSKDDVLKSIDQCTDAPQFGILGEAGVNVLKLNLALDGKK